MITHGIFGNSCAAFTKTEGIIVTEESLIELVHSRKPGYRNFAVAVLLVGVAPLKNS